MITIMKSGEQGLVKIEELVDGCWASLVDPTNEELSHIEKAFGIPLDYLTPALDLDETARAEKDDGTLMIVLRVPLFQGVQADLPYTSLPIGIVITDRVIVTVCKKSSVLIDELAAGQARGLRTGKRSRFFLFLFLMAAKKYLQYLREINKTVDLLEDRLQLSLRNREVLELLKYQKCLTYFTTALKANELMMARLQRGHLFTMYPDDEDLLDDALTEIGQAIEMTNISSGILSQMMDAFASIISNNLNMVMKFLTSVTILLALPTLVASLYGMNLDLPLDHLPHAFWLIMGGAVALSAGVAVIFFRRDWL
jgi:magnesium transporter